MRGMRVPGLWTVVVAVMVALNGCNDDRLSDTTPPAPILDLSITPTGATGARLTWTAPGDNGTEGQAARYKIAFATYGQALTIVDFCGSGILGLESNPIPRAAGLPETLVVGDLVAGQTYLFKIRTEDVALNRSESRVVAVTLPDTTPPSPRWEFLGEAFDGVVLRLIPDGTDLVAVGLFTKIGTRDFPGVARWDGAGWVSMSAGLPDTMGGAIVSLALRSAATVQGKPAICGSLTRLVGSTNRVFPYVATWNGAAWDSLTTGRTGDGFDIIEFNDRLVLSGSFVNIGGLLGANGVAAWNGTDWTAVGPASSLSNASITSLAVDGTSLLVAGTFDTTDAIRSKRLAVFNGVSWRAFGAVDPPGSVFATALFNGMAIVAGGFGIRQVAPGGSPDTLLAGVRHANCTTVTANTLLVDGGRLVVGGNFNLAGAVPSLGLAAWNGTRWSTLGRHDNVGVSAVTRYGARLAVSGGYDDGSGPGVRIRVATIAG